MPYHVIVVQDKLLGKINFLGKSLDQKNKKYI